MKKIISSFILCIIVACVSLTCFAVPVGHITLQVNTDGSLTLIKRSSGNYMIYTIVSASKLESVANMAAQGYVIDNEFCLNKKGPFLAVCNAIKSRAGTQSHTVMRINGSAHLFYVKIPDLDLSALENTRPAGVAVMVAESVTGKTTMVIEDDK